nr:gamma-parvin [Marmota flaviventris]
MTDGGCEKLVRDAHRVESKFVPGWPPVLASKAAPGRWVRGGSGLVWAKEGRRSGRKCPVGGACEAAAGSQAGGGARAPVGSCSLVLPAPSWPSAQRRKLPAATATSRAGPRGSAQGPCRPRRAPATHPPRKRNLPLPAAEDPRGGLISRVQEAPGAKKKYLPPSSRKDPKFEELQKVLVEWINAALLPEHVVVRSLEEDMFDGLILHHLLQKLAGLRLQVEEIALTAASQRRKLEVVLGAVNRALQVEEPQAKWSVEAIFNKDLVATLHLLVALAKHFQPSVPLPSNVQVEVVTIEVTGPAPGVRTQGGAP